MTKGEALFSLIKSMERAEKGYFKKYAAVYAAEKEKHYLVLFQAIDALDVYAEEVLLKKLRGKPVLRQLPVAMHYLFELILKSLRSYKAQHSRIMRINALMEAGEILYEKGLYEIALDKWKKAEELAVEYDEKAFQLDLILLQRRYYQDHTAQDWEKNVPATLERSEMVADAYKEQVIYQKLYYEIIYYIKKRGSIREPVKEAYWVNLTKHPLLAKPAPSTFHAALMYHYIYFFQGELLGYTDQSLAAIQAVIGLWEKHNAIRESSPMYYIAALNNLMTFCANHRYLDLYIETWNRIKVPDVKSMATKANFFENMWIWQYNVHQMQQQLTHRKEWVQSQMELFEAYSPYMNQVKKMVIEYCLAQHFFTLGDPETSLHWLDVVLNRAEVNMRQDLQAYGRIMYVMNHFDLEHFQLLEPNLRSVKRFLQTRSYYYEMEAIFMKGIQKCMGEPPGAARQLVLQQLFDSLQQLARNNPKEAQAMESAGVLVWVGAKAAGKNLFRYFTEDLGWT